MRGLFLRPAKTLATGTSEHFDGVGRRIGRRGQMPRTRIRCVPRLCKGDDDGPGPALKPALSRTAHRDVFALWVFPYGAIGLPPGLPRFKGLPDWYRPPGG